MEAAGVDLRSPLTREQWIKASSRMRATPRPMKIVVECAPREEQDAKEQDAAPISPRAGPPADEAVFQSAGTAGSHRMQHSRVGRLPCNIEVITSILQHFMS